jgi:DNA polymerase-3 subunit epsilon
VSSILTKILGHREKKVAGPVARHRSLKERLELKAPIEGADFVAFDTELTGLDFKRDSMISIGAVRMRGGRILPGQTFYRLVRPDSELKSQGVVVHELTHSDLEKADPVEEVLCDFIDFIGDAILVGHFVFIDVNFVNRAMKRIFGVGLQSLSVDTSALHDWLYESDSHFARHHQGMSLKSDLFSLARKYGIEVEKAHNAMYDAYVTAQLFQRFLPFLPECGVRSLKELLMVSKS